VGEIGIYFEGGGIVKSRVFLIGEYLATRILANLISVQILLRCFKRIRKYEEIFINYRAFGHSISDTNAFLVSGEKSRLCISLGNISERNPYFNVVTPGNNLIQVILPKPKIIGRQNLRKKVGFQLFEIISFIQKKGYLPKLCLVFHDNKSVVLQSIQDIALNKIKLPSDKLIKTIEHIRSMDLTAREHSKSVGTWAQIYDPAKLGFEPRETQIDLRFKQELKKKGFSPSSLVTLILRVGNSPHHGPGVNHYEPTLDFLQVNNYLVIALGDTYSISPELRIRFPNLALATDFDVPTRSVEFASIYYSRFTLGDMSGIWPIFTIRGTRGLCLNTIPTKFLMNRVEVLPRLWIDKEGLPLSLDAQFEIYGETVRGRNRETEIDGYKPSFHTPETLLKCVKRFERDLVIDKPLKLDERYSRYFSEFPPEMLTNCSIAPELLEAFNEMSNDSAIR
jgi:hypothetical protein